MEICGILPVHKPVGPTSHDVVDRVRRLFEIRQVGHTGTLDPLAEGLLLLCLGRATKVSRYLSGEDKTYRATIRLGQRTSTGDADGEVISTGETAHLTQPMIQAALEPFRGTINQKAPAHSAVQVRGRRLYAYAREGAEVPEVVREVEIHEITIEEFRDPDVTINVRCSSGTYIRALADDLGTALGCGAHLASLTRTRIGTFDNQEAERLEGLEQLSLEERKDRVRPMEKFLKLPVVTLFNGRENFIRQGMQVFLRGILELPEQRFARGDRLLLCNETGRALAVVVARYDVMELADNPIDPWYKYERVLI